jgi:hypothetical protein
MEPIGRVIKVPCLAHSSGIRTFVRLGSVSTELRRGLSLRKRQILGSALC